MNGEGGRLRRWRRYVQNDKAMLFGKFYNSIDEKNRCKIPTKFRDELGANCMMLLGPDDNIYIFRQDEHMKFIEESVLPLDMTAGGEIRDKRNFYLDNTVECEVDKQGRVSLPAEFIEWAHIKKELVTVGRMNHIVIWGREYYDEYQSPKAAGIRAVHELASARGGEKTA
jgi:MraZ protein